MSDSLKLLLKKISDWEYQIAVSNNKEEVRELEQKIQEMGDRYAESSKELSEWIAAFKTSLKEQEIYAAWDNMRFSSMLEGNSEKQEQLRVERHARLKIYDDAGKLEDAPNWLWPTFNERLEPAMSVALNGQGVDERLSELNKQ